MLTGDNSSDSIDPGNPVFLLKSVLQSELDFSSRLRGQNLAELRVIQRRKGRSCGRRPELRTGGPGRTRQACCGNCDRLKAVRQVESVCSKFDPVPFRDPELPREREIYVPVGRTHEAVPSQTPNRAQRLRRESRLVDVEGARSAVPGVYIIGVHHVGLLVMMVLNS